MSLLSALARACVLAALLAVSFAAPASAQLYAAVNPADQRFADTDVHTLALEPGSDALEFRVPRELGKVRIMITFSAECSVAANNPDHTLYHAIKVNGRTVPPTGLRSELHYKALCSNFQGSSSQRRSVSASTTVTVEGSGNDLIRIEVQVQGLLRGGDYRVGKTSLVALVVGLL